MTKPYIVELTNALEAKETAKPPLAHTDEVQSKQTANPTPQPDTEAQPHTTAVHTRSPTQSNPSNNIQYIDMNAYSKYRNETTNIIPSSWQQLNNQQFCSAPESSTSLSKFMNFIYDMQFGLDCDDPNHKFVLFDVKIETGNGLGASMLGNIKRYFAASLMLNRTFILTGAYDWSYDRSYCEGKDGMECYFLPVSKCNPMDILKKYNTSDTYFAGRRPTHCIFGNNNDGSLSHCEYTVIHITTGDGHYVLLNGEINTWIQQKFNLKMMEYEAIIPAFFLRPQPVVRNIIYDKIHKSIRKSLETVDIESINTKTLISYPIRASDKCNSITHITGKKYTHKSESECFTPYEHVKVMNSIKYFANNTINTVIFTSEDSSFLDQVVKAMKNKNISNVSEWNIIRNTEDFSVGEGTTTYKATLKTFNVELDDGAGTSLEKDHIVSALSSLVFQVHLEPEYIVYGDSSTWLKLMWKWLVFLNCNIVREAHVADNAKCIELSTPGYLHYHGKFPYKFITYSEDLWKRIRNENITAEHFVDRFGINITKFGWERYCEKGFKNKLKF